VLKTRGLEKGVDIWTLLWILIINDYAVKYSTIIIKSLLTLVPKRFISYQLKVRCIYILILVFIHLPCIYILTLYLYTYLVFIYLPCIYILTLYVYTYLVFIHLLSFYGKLSVPCLCI